MAAIRYALFLGVMGLVLLLIGLVIGFIDLIPPGNDQALPAVLTLILGIVLFGIGVGWNSQIGRHERALILSQGLLSGERALKIARATSIEAGRRSGFLVLTNLRLLFFTQAQSKASGPPKPILVVPIDDIHNLRVETQKTGEPPKTIIIAGYRFRLFRHARDFRDAVVNASIVRQKTAPGFTQTTSTKGVPGQTTTTQVIREIVKVPCRFCGRLNLQTDPNCAGCGAPTH